MKKYTRSLAVIWAALFMAAGIPTAVAQTGGGNLDISATACSGTTAANAPASNLFDGGHSSSWKLVPTAAGGWVEAELDQEALVYGIELSATISTDAVLRVQFLHNDRWCTYAAGTIGSGSYGAAFFDFSYNRVITKRMRIVLEGGDASTCEIREVAVKGICQKDILSLAPIKRVKPSENSSLMYPPENLIDGSLYTEWKTAISTHGFRHDYDGKPKDLREYYQRFGHEPRCLPPHRSESSVAFELEKEILLESILVYFGKESKGDMEVYARVDKKWELIELIPEGMPGGWHLISAHDKNITTDEVKIELKHGRGEFHEGLSEVEIWGYRGFKGDSYIPPTVFEPHPLAQALNGTFFMEEEKSGSLEIAFSGVVSSEVKAELNGRLLPGAQVKTINNQTVVSFPVNKGRLWEEDNYFRIHAMEHAVVESVYFRTRENTREQVIVDDSLTDHVLFTEDVLSPEKIIELGRIVLVKRIELYARDPGYVTLSIWENGAWRETNFSDQKPGVLVYSIHCATDKIKLETNGNAPGELRILASPTKDSDPFVKILWPNSGDSIETLHAGRYRIVGYVDNPDTTVTVNGVQAEKKGQYFWIAMKDAGIDEPGEYTITATAVAGNGRRGSDAVSILYNYWTWFRLAGEDGYFYTSTNTVKISGYMMPHEYTVTIDGVEAEYSQSTFSRTIEVEEGFTLVPVKLYGKKSGKLLATVYAKVIRYSGELKLVVDFPPENHVTYADRIDVRGRVDGIGKIKVEVQNKQAQVDGKAFEAKEIKLKEGINTITVTASDKTGRTATKTIPVLKDTKKPVIGNIQPAQDTLLTVSTVTVSGTVHDANTVWVYVNGTPAVTDDQNFSLTVTIQDGHHTLPIYAQDAAGNRSDIYELRIVVDTTAPENLTVTADPAGWTSNTRPVITFSADDATSGISRYELWVDEGTAETVTSPYTLPEQADGEHTVYVRVYDNAGWVTVGSTKIFIDTVAPPVVPIFRIAAGKDRVTLKWCRPADDVVQYRIFRSSNEEEVYATADGEALSYADDGLEPTTQYNYSMIAVDHAGNMSAPTEWKRGIAGMTEVPIYQGQDILAEYENVFFLSAADPFVVDEDITPELLLISEVESPQMEELTPWGSITPLYNISVVLNKDDKLYHQEHINLNKDFLCGITYDEANLPGEYGEENLGVYYFDSEWAKWFRISKCAVDKEHNIIYFKTNHFSTFSVQPTMIEDLSPQELNDVGYSPLKVQSVHEGVTVSPQGGTAQVQVTELVLPGKNGFDFVLKRTYDSATARGDSLGINMNLNISIRFTDAFAAANVTDLLGLGVQTGTQLTSQLVQKVKSYLQNTGDYTYSMGTGWRLNLPYIRGGNSSVIIRTPSGSFHDMRNMKKTKELDLGVYRELTLVNHENEDFELKVTQVRADLDVVSILSNGFFGGSYSGGTNEAEKYADINYIMGFVKVPGWCLLSAEMTLKDGTKYYFDNSGKVTEIQDPRNQNRIGVEYDGLGCINTITDSMGRKIKFEYDTGAMLAPEITRIYIEGDEQNSSITYAQKKGEVLGEAISVPLLAKAIDAGGREWHYDYDYHFLASGGGSVKINLLSLLFSIVDVTGVFANAFMPAPIELSANTQLEFVFLLDAMHGPGIGYSKWNNKKVPLTYFQITPEDFLFGVVPTAIQFTFQMINRMVVDKVELYDGINGGLVKTTTYDYNIDYVGEGQFCNASTVEDDGRQRKTYAYNAIKRQRNRFITWSDYVAEQINSMAFSDWPWYYEYVPVNTSIATQAAGDFDGIETASMQWDTTTMRLASRRLERGAQNYSQIEYIYDDWANPVYIKESSVTGDRNSQKETWMRYANTTSTPADVFLSWTNPYDAPSVPEHIHNLLLGSVIKNTPPQESGLTDPVYLVSYNDYSVTGQLAASSALTGSAWAETVYTYYSDHGSMETVTKPNGHVTRMVYDYHFLSHPDYYTITSIEKNVADADGVTRDITIKQAFSFHRGNLLWSRNPEGYVTENQYDSLGRVTKIIQPDDDAGEKTWNPETAVRPNADNNPVTAIEYNDTSLWSRVTNPNNAKVFYDYDNIGRLHKIEKENEGNTKYAEITITHDAWNNITSITDPNGNTTRYKYDATGRPAKITHPEYNGKIYSRTMAFSYDTNTLTTTDENGNLKLEVFDISNNLLKTTLYNTYKGIEQIESYMYYDGLGNAVASIDPLGNKTVNVYNNRNLLARTILPEEKFFENGTEVTAAPYVRYEYNNAGIKIKDIVSTPHGEQEVIYESDGLGRVIKTRTTFTDPVEGRKEAVTEVFYDNLGNKIKTIDANNAALKYVGKQYYTNDTIYSAKNKPLVQANSVLHGFSGTVIDEGKKTTFTYDVSGNVKSMTGPRGNNTKYAGDFTLLYNYDDLNRLVKADLPRGTGEAQKRVVRFVYDKRGNALEQIEPDGARTVYTYTPLNKVETEAIIGSATDPSYTTRHVYDGLGNTTKTIDNMGHETKNTYDSLSRVVRVQYPEGNSERYAYDKNSNMIQTTDGEERNTRKEYNAYKKLTALVDAMDNRYEYFYDRLGNKTKEKDPNDNIYRYGYDELKRLVKETTSLGNEYTYRYDLSTNIIRSVDANGTVGVYEYTPEYLIDSIHYTNGVKTRTLSYAYDEAGDLITVQDGDVVKRYNTSGGIYTPDPYSRILNLTTEFEGRITTVAYSYDNRDRITGVTYPNGNIVEYEYNSIGQLVNVPGYLGEAPQYSNVGLIAKLKATNGTETHYAYDDNLRLTNLSYTGKTLEEIRTYDFTYDNANNIVKKNNSTYTYDKLNRLLYAEENGRFNATDPMKEQTAGLAEKDFIGESALLFDLTENSVVKLDYNARSVGIDLGGTFYVSRLVIHPENTANRLHAQSVDVFASLVNTEGQYMKVDTKTLVTRDDGVIEIRLDDAVQARYIKLHCYFDDRDIENNPVDRSTVNNTALKLLTVHYMVDWRNESFEYNSIGNRMKRTVSLGGDPGAETPYTYYKNTEGGDSQRLMSDDSYTYTYDKNGNLTKKIETATGNGWQYEFSLLNRLVGVHKIEGNTTTPVASYLYDTSGYRIKKESTKEGKTYYTFSANGALLLTEKTKNNTQYIYVFNKLFGKIEREAGAIKKYFFHTDHLGSTVAITDETGAVVWKNDFTPFGTETGYEGSEEHEGKYTGKDLDEETGLYYFNARWYDPTMGRFISEDPIKDGLNWYVYTGNNPLNLIDPTGLDPAEIITDPDVIQKGVTTFEVIVGGGGVTGLTGLRLVGAVAIKASVFAYLALLVSTGHSGGRYEMDLNDGYVLKQENMPEGWSVYTEPTWSHCTDPYGNRYTPEDFRVNKDGQVEIIGAAALIYNLYETYSDYLSDQQFKEYLDIYVNELAEFAHGNNKDNKADHHVYQLFDKTGDTWKYGISGTPLLPVAPTIFLTRSERANEQIINIKEPVSGKILYEKIPGRPMALFIEAVLVFEYYLRNNRFPDGNLRPRPTGLPNLSDFLPQALNPFE